MDVVNALAVQPQVVRPIVFGPYGAALLPIIAVCGFAGGAVVGGRKGELIQRVVNLVRNVKGLGPLEDMVDAQATVDIMEVAMSSPSSSALLCNLTTGHDVSASSALPASGFFPNWDTVYRLIETFVKSYNVALALMFAIVVVVLLLLVYVLFSVRRLSSNSRIATEIITKTLEREFKTVDARLKAIEDRLEGRLKDLKTLLQHIEARLKKHLSDLEVLLDVISKEQVSIRALSSTTFARTCAVRLTALRLEQTVQSISDQLTTLTSSITTGDLAQRLNGFEVAIAGTRDLLPAVGTGLLDAASSRSLNALLEDVQELRTSLSHLDTKFANTAHTQAQKSYEIHLSLTSLSVEVRDTLSRLLPSVNGMIISSPHTPYRNEIYPNAMDTFHRHRLLALNQNAVHEVAQRYSPPSHLSSPTAVSSPDQVEHEDQDDEDESFVYPKPSGMSDPSQEASFATLATTGVVADRPSPATAAPRGYGSGDSIHAH